MYTIKNIYNMTYYIIVFISREYYKNKRPFRTTMLGWLFNGTSTQKGQVVPTAREGNWLRMANEIQQ